MPRATRAALRAQELLDETTQDAAAIALPSTPKQDRVVLGEISSNINAGTEVSAPDVSDVTSKPPQGQSKKKAGKRGKGLKKAMEKDDTINVLEDDSCSSKSEAAVEASNLLSDQDSKLADARVLEDETSSLQSLAVEAAIENLNIDQAVSSNPKSHLCDEQEPLHPTVLPAGETTMVKDDVLSRESAGHQPTDQYVGRDDSFLERIKSRSPAKRVSRIEDSVEALDVLEDEIEKVGEALPATVDQPAHEQNTKSSPKSASALSKTSRLRSKKSTTAPSKPAAAKTASTRGGARAAGPALRSSLAASRQSIMKTPWPRSDASAISPRTSVQAATKTFSGKTATASKRVSSIHKAPFQPVKSTKPTTISSFELPGEAVARKLREKREERQKKEEEEHAKYKQFKAKPVRTSQAPDVKMTAAAKARLSLAQKAPIEGPKHRDSLIAASSSIAANKKRLSSLTVAKRDAASSKHNVTQPATRHIVDRKPSINAAVQQRKGPTSRERAQQNLKGKEVFNRGLTALSDSEREKKTKEEAAKKAREDAAERGRIASREWAEKQKVRKMAALKAKETQDALPTSS